jgi:hypothetical protein
MTKIFKICCLCIAFLGANMAMAQTTKAKIQAVAKNGLYKMIVPPEIRSRSKDDLLARSANHAHRISNTRRNIRNQSQLVATPVVYVAVHRYWWLDDIVFFDEINQGFVSFY